MKKLVLSIIPLILLVGCWKKKPQPGHHLVKKEIHEVTVNRKAKKLFVNEGEDIDTFALIDDNSFDEEGPVIHLIEEPKNTHWMEKRTEQHNHYGLQTIYFDFDSEEIRPDQLKHLQENTDKIDNLIKAGKAIIIEGHACKFGKSGQYNMMLSERRAHSVKKYLMKKGIPEKFLKVVGRGSEMCVVEHGSMEEQSPNRRVEFYLNQ
jgi:outer membrane protein OmpA-like peptidoglycan-associated protein